MSTDTVTGEGRDLGGNEPSVVERSEVTPEYFHLLGIPLLRGRSFNDADTDKTPQVAVINDSFSFGEKEIARAQGMVDGYLQAVAQGRGSVVVADGTFVDEAGYKRAMRILRVGVRKPSSETEFAMSRATVPSRRSMLTCSQD